MDTFVWVAVVVLIIVIAIATVTTSVNKYSNKLTKKYLDKSFEQDDGDLGEQDAKVTKNTKDA